LDCGYCTLTSLDISDNAALEYLDCSYNKLTSLDFSGNGALEYLDGSFNQLTSLDVSGYTALTYLNCEVYEITNLDVSHNLDLIFLICGSNQLSNINISNNINLLSSPFLHLNGILDLSQMPTLYEVCVWEMPFPPEDIFGSVDTTDSPNVYFATDCAVNIPGYYKENTKIDIYPNPTKDYLNIVFNKNVSGLKTIEMVNITGETVYNKNIGSLSGILNYEIDISEYNSGVYFVIIRSDMFSEVHKISKIE